MESASTYTHPVTGSVSREGKILSEEVRAMLTDDYVELEDFRLTKVYI